MSSFFQTLGKKALLLFKALIITQIKVQACYADLFLLAFGNSTNIKKNFETGWTIHSIKISIEYLKILYWFIHNLPLLNTGHFSLRILISEKKSWWYSLSLRNTFKHLKYNKLWFNIWLLLMCSRQFWSK